MAAQGYCVIGFARATRLAGFLLGAALVPAVLIAAAACDPMDFGIGAQADGETAEAASPPPEPPPEPPAELPAVAAPALVAEPPLAKVAAFLPAPPLPREKPALVLTVAAGDTLHGIAVRHGVAARRIIALNGLNRPYWLQMGQRLGIPRQANGTARLGEPPAEADRLVLRQAGAPASEAGAPHRAARATPSASAAPAPRFDRAEPAPSSPVQRPGSASVPLPPTRNTFLWPIEGRLISRFGSKPGGMHNDGINVAAPVGSEVRAAQNGVVAYAGNELRGYGNLVLIRHEDGWMTAYAHNDSLLVGKGDVVQRGQVISHSGKSGRVSRPQAHFEIRRNGEPQDPLRLFTSR